METRRKHNSFDAWRLVEDKFDIESNAVQETLFSLGNGYIGLRGTHEERFAKLSASTVDATFINGFYESSTLHYPEVSYGWAKVHQFMLSVPNGKCINFAIDGENFDISQGEIISFKREIDFRTGLLERNIEWRSPAGHQVSVRSRRLVSFTRKNIYAIEYEITALNFSGAITLHSILDNGAYKEESDEPLYGAAVAAVEGVHLALSEIEQAGDFSAFNHRTKHSGLTIVSAIESDLLCPGSSEASCKPVSNGKDRVEQVYRVAVKEGETICLTKYGGYFTSRQYPESELMAQAKTELKKARQAGFAVLCDEQKAFLSDFWHHANIEIEGNDPVQEGVRFSQFHLLQSVGRDGQTSIAAKGLTGEGYGGHYFWDAEIYALPFYLYTRPEIAKKMLEYRYSILDASRARARELAHPKGALYAWRTIGGEECSAYFPSGTAQYHINCDIAFAIKQYYEATNDIEFMTKCGAEMVMETARIWIGIGSYIGRKGDQFCINKVTGPDEYTALVNNNFYTNAMAQMHLRFAASLFDKLKKEHPQDFRRIAKAMDLTDDEPAQWLKAAAAMRLPYDKELGIHAQDDDFLARPVWDFAGTPPECHPLPLHYHYLVIYRHQVCKQADVVLADLLLGDRFDSADKKRDFDYYDAITTHESSLSHCTFSIMASELGYHDKALDYFMHTARGDLDDLHNNTAYGVHIAAMAGTWMAVVYGFGGMRAYEGKLQFAPYLPDSWKRYSFRVYFQAKLILVEVDKNEIKYSLLAGDALQFHHDGRAMQLSKANAVQTVPAKVVAAKQSVALKGN